MANEPSEFPDISSAAEPNVREEVIEQEFSQVLRRMRFDEEIVPSMIRALRESHADEQRDHDEAIARLRDEQERLRKRIHEMYIDKLDGKVDPAFYDRRHQSTDRTYLEEGVQLLELSQAAPKLFEKNPPHEKRRLLNFLLSNSVWKNGSLLRASGNRLISLRKQQPKLQLRRAQKGQNRVNILFGWGTRIHER